MMKLYFILSNLLCDERNNIKSLTTFIITYMARRKSLHCITKSLKFSTKRRSALIQKITSYCQNTHLISVAKHNILESVLLTEIQKDLKL